MHVWDCEKHVPIQDIDLGTGDGMLPLEVRFLHDPDEAQGYVGVALSSNVFRFFKNEVCIHLLGHNFQQKYKLKFRMAPGMLKRSLIFQVKG